MKKVVTKTGGAHVANNFEKTNQLINSLLDPGNAIRGMEGSRQRVIPKMITHPLREAPHM